MSQCRPVELGNRGSGTQICAGLPRTRQPFTRSDQTAKSVAFVRAWVPSGNDNAMVVRDRFTSKADL